LTKGTGVDVKKLFSIDGKVALVTGGAAGIGAMIAEGLLDAGAKVYICGRTEASLLRTAARLKSKGEIGTIVADVGSEDGIAALKREMSAKERKLHILVNNVGATHKAPMAEYSRAEFNRVLNINITATFECVKALLPLLKAAAQPDDPARVINIGSIGARKIMPLDNFAYSASKAGLDTLTRHLGAQLVRDHINVNCIPCGLFRTELAGYLFDPKDPRYKNRPNIPMDRPGEPEDITGAVIYLSSRASNYVTGIRLPVAGGQSTVDWERPQA
jgi:NAD(P)-dependent dehydrogenase (short-subunit alcohol dehydrogenase family)